MCDLAREVFLGHPVFLLVSLCIRSFWFGRKCQKDVQTINVDIKDNQNLNMLGLSLRQDQYSSG